MNRKIFFGSIVLIAMFMLSSAFTGNLVIGGVKTDSNYKSLAGQTRTDEWILNLQANFNNPEWYYLNLNSTDRLAIRLALDYAIPRQDIIKYDYNGFGTLLPTTELPQTGQYFNSNITMRTYNLTKARELLAQVFGYTYNATFNNPATPYNESQPYFSLEFIVPTVYTQRELSANRTEASYNAIGVKTTQTLLSMATQIANRIFYNRTEADYVHGGYDGLFIGFLGSIIPDDGYQFYDSASMPIFNYQYLNSSYVDGLINTEDTNHNFTTRLTAYHDLQSYIYDNALKNVLLQVDNTYVMNNQLQGFNPFYANQFNLPLQLMNFTSGKKNMNMAVGYNLTYLNPIFSPYWYSNYFVNPLWAGGLLSLEDMPNDTTQTHPAIYNNMANWYNVSSDGLTYFFNLKSGLKWQDNTPITTADVNFTYVSAMQPNILSAYYKPLINQLYPNATSIKIINSTMIEFKLHTWNPLPLLNLFTVPIIPEHVYSKIPYANWMNDSTDTGTGIQNIVGSGPYQFLNYTNGVMYLQAWSGWNSTYDKLFANEPLHGVPQIQNITIMTNSNTTSVLASLKSGAVDFAGSTIHLENIYSQVEKTTGITIVNATGVDYQELDLNQASSIWGANPLDPWGSQLNYTHIPLLTVSTIPTTPTITPTTSPISTSPPVSTNPTTSSLETISQTTPGFEFYLPIILFLTLSVFVIRKRRKT